MCTPNFTVALFIIAKIWKQKKSINGEWIKKLWYMYIRILFSHKKQEIFPFVTTWMDFKGIMLSEISQTERDKYDLSYMWNIKQTNKKPRSSQTLRTD